MKAAALFCGMGGASRGMKAAGLQVVKSYDWAKQEVDAHRWLEPDIPCEQRDVATIGAGELRGLFVWASPSCKPYSTANRTPTRGKKHPEYYSLAYLAEQLRHTACAVIENVPGLLWSVEGKAEMLELQRACIQLRMPMSVHVLASNQYGVSQYRKRAIILLNAPYTMFGQGTPVAAQGAVMATEHRGQWKGGAAGNFRASPSRLFRTLEVCAELQGLPIPPHKSKTEAHRLLGNAVPPLLAEAVCRAVLSSMACEVAV